jgi:hypothetical protein
MNIDSGVCSSSNDNSRQIEFLTQENSTSQLHYLRHRIPHDRSRYTEEQSFDAREEEEMEYSSEEDNGHTDQYYYAQHE